MHWPISTVRFLVVWFAMACAMSVNGVARELLLKRLMSPRVAEVLSAVIGFGLIAVITRLGFQNAIAPGTRVSSLVALSVSLVVLTVVFETAMGRLVDHKSWAQIGEH